MGRGFEGKARLALAGAELDLERRPEPARRGLSGPLTLKSADLFPALAALGMGTAGTGAAAPADLTAELKAGPRRRRPNRRGARRRAGERRAQMDAAARRGFARTARALAQSPDAPLAEARRRSPARWSSTASRWRRCFRSRSAVRRRPGRARLVGAEVRPGADEAAVARRGLKIGALDTPLGLGRAAAARLRMDRDRLALDDARRC